MKSFLETKYGPYVTSQFLTDTNQVVKKEKGAPEVDDQHKVMEFLKSLEIVKKKKDGKAAEIEKTEKLVPEEFLNANVKWGFDFSSWIGTSENKDYFFIGAEPHLDKNYQLVYGFGNYPNHSITETAVRHYNKADDIFHYLTNIFAPELTDEAKTAFLSKCYVTDLCHIVPQGCGQVKTIAKKLNSTPAKWRAFRTNVANKFLVEEIETVKPRYIITHGNAAREFFADHLTETYPIEGSKFSIKAGHFNGRRIISIPHLKGDMRNKLWKCKKHPQRPVSAKMILTELVK